MTAQGLTGELVRSLRRKASAARHPRKLFRDERLKRQFAAAFLGGRSELARYERELSESGLIEHLRRKSEEFNQALRAAGQSDYSSGVIAYMEGRHLYAVLRKLRPRYAVETGVANGFSTAFSLAALDRNGAGELYSIDLPRELGRRYESGEFFEGKGKAGIPPGREPGWLVPERLRERWTLVLGRSGDELPPLLERLGTIDSFLHDSEHSFENMWFEFNTAWPALREGGVLLSHDINTTPAFFRFASEHRREPVRLSNGMALLVK